MSLINSSVAADDHSAGRRYQWTQQPSRRILFPTAGHSASALPAVQHTLQSPKILVDGGQKFLFPTDGEGPAKIVGVSASASAQPWGTSLPLKHRAWREHNAYLPDWVCSYSSYRQQIEQVYLKTANQI